MELTKDVLERLEKLPTGNVADNNTSAPRQGVMDSGIKPLDPKCHMVGRAVTVRCYPGDNLALHQGIYAAKPGDCDGVVVVPQAVEDEVFAKAEAKFEKEEHLVEMLKAGKTTLEIYGFDNLIEKLKAI